MKTLTQWNEIPSFDTEESEIAFWLSHQMDTSLMRSALHQPDSRESITITLRFDPRMLARIKRVARLRYLNYQSMIKQWLSERLASEVKNLDDTQDNSH